MGFQRAGRTRSQGDDASTPGTSDLGAVASVREAILEAFAHAASDALLGHDATGRITTCNRSAERIVGYAEREIVGRDILTLFPQHLRAEVSQVYDRALSGEPVDHVETEMQRKLDMPVPVSLSVHPVVDDGGSVVGAVSIAQDVTETRLAQASLAEVEARRRGGEAQVHVGRWLWDVGTGAVQWSDELHRIHGIDPLDFAGTFEAHVACACPDDRTRLREAMQAAARSGRSFEVEYRIVRPDGSERAIYVRGEPELSSAGLVVGVRGIGHDVTTDAVSPGRSAP